MKRYLRLSAGLGLLSAVALAESFTGNVVDVKCKDKDLASHTKKCAMGCKASGYGLMTADGKFLKFDEAGNAKTLEALTASAKEKDLKAKVMGSVDGEVLKVESIELE